MSPSARSAAVGLVAAACVFSPAPFAGDAGARDAGRLTGEADSTPAVLDSDAAESRIDVKVLFAAQCSWCHDALGMAGGKGPKLAGTTMTERQLIDRIRNGKPGTMPGYKKMLTDEQIAALAAYIKGLKDVEE